MSYPGMLDDWANSCVNNGTKVMKLEEHGKFRLFQIYDEYCDGRNMFRDVITYHVWVGDDWVAATTNYLEAYNVWKNRCKG